MSSSDWGSDVCSSDLRPWRRPTRHSRTRAAPHRSRAACRPADMIGRGGGSGGGFCRVSCGEADREPSGGAGMSGNDDIVLSELDDDELVQQMHDDLYDGLKDEIVEAVNILLGRGWTPYDVLTKALVEGMRIVGIDRSEEHTSELQSLMRIS